MHFSLLKWQEPSSEQQQHPADESSSFTEAPLPNCSPSNSSAAAANNNSNLAWELFKLVKYGWYWGRMTRGEAERKLAEQPDGKNIFLISYHAAMINNFLLLQGLFS